MNPKIITGAKAGAIASAAISIIVQLVILLPAILGRETSWLAPLNSPYLPPYFLVILIVFYFLTFAVFYGAAGALTGTIFAFVQDKIPTKRKITKAYIFYFAVTAILTLLLAPFLTEDLLSATFGTAFIYYLVSAIDFLLWPSLFVFLLNRFNKHTEKTPVANHPKNISYAPIKRRVAAFLIDDLIIILAYIAIAIIMRFKGANIISGIPTNESFYLFATVGVVIFSLIYLVVSEVRFGATFGKQLLKIRVERIEGGNINYPKALIRNITKYFSELITVLPFVIGLIYLPLNEPRQRALDKLAGTVVVLDKNPKLSKNQIIAAVVLCILTIFFYLMPA